MIGFILSTMIFACPEDCSKVLVANEHRKPEIHTQVVKKEQPNKDFIVTSCIDMGDGKCVVVDERSGFYPVVTWEK